LLLVKKDISKLPMLELSLDSILIEFISVIISLTDLFPIYLLYISIKSISFLYIALFINNFKFVKIKYGSDAVLSILIGENLSLNFKVRIVSICLFTFSNNSDIIVDLSVSSIFGVGAGAVDGAGAVEDAVEGACVSEVAGAVEDAVEGAVEDAVVDAVDDAVEGAGTVDGAGVSDVAGAVEGAGISGAGTEASVCTGSELFPDASNPSKSILFL